jgi:hypothetical protein
LIVARPPACDYRVPILERHTIYYSMAPTSLAGEDVKAGVLTAKTDSLGLATFYATVIQGMSTQACDGASRSDLERVVKIAMNAWPA